MNRSLVLFTALLFSAVPALPADEPRTALVVGCDYAGTALQLPSPTRDAQALARALKEPLGFEVTLLSNPTRKEMLAAIDRFGETLGRRGGVGLFYFSGHGAQFEGENYLLPTSAAIGFREDLPSETISAGRVVTRMEAAGNRINLLFLDACRNNPLPSAKQKGVFQKGFAAMNAANGMLIGFATARDTAANDSGEGSLYTNALLRHIVTPGLSVTDMLTRVNAEVRKTSGGSQVPFMEVGLSDVFSFVPGNATTPATASPPVEAAKLEPAKPALPPHSAAAPVIRAAREAPYVNSLGMEFVPAGTRGVLFCKWDARVRDYREFVNATNRDMSGGITVIRVKRFELDRAASWSNPGFQQSDAHPVIGVNLEDSRAFCAWLTAKEQKAGLLPPGAAYRLPSDDEWSAAAGPGKYPWGDSWPPHGKVGNYADATVRNSLPEKRDVVPGLDDGWAQTSPVGTYKANQYGLFDMGGNVWQWCDTQYRAALNSADVIQNSPSLKNETADDGTPFQVVRGGSWRDYNPFYIRTAHRDNLPPGGRYVLTGFRCVLVVAGG